eukprot:jgi/Chlat1/6601/Chrsp46S06093
MRRRGCVVLGVGAVVLLVGLVYYYYVGESEYRSLLGPLTPRSRSGQSVVRKGTPESLALLLLHNGTISAGVHAPEDDDEAGGSRVELRATGNSVLDEVLVTLQQQLDYYKRRADKAEAQLAQYDALDRNNNNTAGQSPLLASNQDERVRELEKQVEVLEAAAAGNTGDPDACEEDKRVLKDLLETEKAQRAELEKKLQTASAEDAQAIKALQLRLDDEAAGRTALQAQVDSLKAQATDTNKQQQAPCPEQQQLQQPLDNSHQLLALQGVDMAPRLRELQVELQSLRRQLVGALAEEKATHPQLLQAAKEAFPDSKEVSVSEAQSKLQALQANPSWSAFESAHKRYPLVQQRMAEIHTEMRALAIMQQHVDAADPIARVEFDSMDGLGKSQQRHGAVNITSRAVIPTDDFLDGVNITIVVDAIGQPTAAVDEFAKFQSCFKSDNPMQLTAELLVQASKKGVERADQSAQWGAAAALSQGFMSVVFSEANGGGASATNRLASMARGDIIIFLQAAQAPPADCGWVYNLMKVSQRWPRVGLIGLSRASFRDDDTIMDGANDTDMYFMDSHIDVKMQFVSVVASYPFAAKRRAFKQAGMLDSLMALPGAPLSSSPGQVYDLSLRTWLVGYWVAQLHVPTPGFGLVSGVAQNQAAVQLQEFISRKVCREVRYTAADYSRVFDMVKGLNRYLVATDVANPEPWGVSER